MCAHCCSRARGAHERAIEFKVRQRRSAIIAAFNFVEVLPEANMMRSPLLVTTVMACLVLLTGCADSKQAQQRITKFSDAGQTVAVGMAEAYDQVNQQVIDARIERLINDYAQDRATANPRSVEPLLTGPVIQARRDVLRGLHLYSKLLADLMSDDQLDEFGEATQELGSELVALGSSEFGQAYLKGMLSQENAEILASAVQLLGDFLIRYKRQQAVEQIVTDMDETVGQICRLLGEDLVNVESELSRAMRETIRERNQFIINNYDDLSVSERRDAITALASLVLRERELAGAIGAVRDSISKLAETHSKLKDAFTDDPRELDNLIASLTAEAQRVQSFYKALKN